MVCGVCADVHLLQHAVGRQRLAKPLCPGRTQRAVVQRVERGGNLCLRVFMREPNEALEQQLTGEIEKLGGHLDISSERALVYSIHFGVGFQAIEKLLDANVKTGEVRWLYGNVYDDQGEPLNWWQDLLKA